MKIAVGTSNESRVQGLLEVAEQLFGKNPPIEIQCCRVETGVFRQPLSSHTTHKGALNRAKNIRAIYPGADYFIGIESGVRPSHHCNGNFITIDWAVVIDRIGDTAKSVGGGLTIPSNLCREIAQGAGETTLKDALLSTCPDFVKKGGGSVTEFLTHGTSSRLEETRLIVARALSPFLNKALFQETFQRN